MDFALAPEALAAGYRLAAYETIGSTSTDAMTRAQAGERGPLWVVARRQSAGLGRRGSVWQTRDGNLAASLLLTTDLPPARIATLGFVAGLALGWALDRCVSVEARLRPAPQDESRLSAFSNNPHPEVSAQRASKDASPSRVLRGSTFGRAPQHEGRGEGDERTPFALKWPNDVMADGAKLAGILLATEEIGPGLRAVTIGIGVNVAHAPDDLPYEAASLHGLGCTADAADLFTALSASWVKAYGIWCGPAGFEEIRRSWLARAAGLGGAVAVKSAGGVTRGIFETIDEHGQLVVRISDGSARKVSAGEVHFGVAGSATPELRA